MLRGLWRALPFTGPARPLVSVIELSGVIGAVGAGRKGLTLSRLEKAIEAAFKPQRLNAVALAINSPGGSPVQARLIFSAIRRCARKRQRPVLAFIEDVGASGGYILALAADEIYADESSVIGSIGVISATFGLQDMIAKAGVERRIYTAGENKSQLDPFRPEDPEDVARLKEILDDIHAQFISLVRERRGDKVADSKNDEIYSGAFWTAEAARERGLIDGTAHLGDFLRTRYGEDVKIRKFSPEGPSLLKRLLSGEALSDLGPEALIEGAEARAMWARYGI
ncbi:MAG: S49 family peptidase [Parvularculaceae bacterium]